MKLWQRVFLWSMALMMLSVMALAAFIAQHSHRQNLDREQQQALQEHELLLTAVQTMLVSERGSDGTFLTADETVEAFAAHIKAIAAGRDDLSLELFRDGVPVCASRLTAAPSPEGREELTVEAGQTAVICYGQEMFTASRVRLENREYVLVSGRSIAPLFEQRSRQLKLIAAYGTAVTAVVTIILLCITRAVLRPLSRLEKAADRISRGDYAIRLPVRGNSEADNLSEAFNTMAEAVQTTVADLEAVAEERKRFTDNLAHEMKTPLTSIIGYADLLRSARTLDDEQRVEFADIIYQEGRHLKIFSGKLMDLIRVGSAGLDLQRIELTEFLPEVGRLTEPLVTQRGLVLDVYVRYRMSITGDPALLQSLLFNLIDNAAKASQPGKHVIVSARRDRRGRVHLAVADHGRGMPPEETRKVTRAFYMLDKARSRAEGGAGLGLALCAEIVKCHNAQMSISSQVGVGTIVDIAFPQEANA